MPAFLERARRLIVQPAQEWATIAGEFTTVGPIYWRYVIPMAAIGPLALTLGTLISGERSSLGGTYGLSPMDAVTGGVLEYGLSLLGVFGLAALVERLATMFGGQANRVQAVKIAAYGTTPYWLGGVTAVFPKLTLLGMVFALYSVRLFATGLAPVMKTPREKTAAYTLLVTIAAMLIVLVISAVVRIFIF